MFFFHALSFFFFLIIELKSVSVFLFAYAFLIQLLCYHSHLPYFSSYFTFVYVSIKAIIFFLHIFFLLPSSCFVTSFLFTNINNTRTHKYIGLYKWLWMWEEVLNLSVKKWRKKNKFIWKRLNRNIAQYEFIANVNCTSIQTDKSSLERRFIFFHFILFLLFFLQSIGKMHFVIVVSSVVWFKYMTDDLWAEQITLKVYFTLLRIYCRW